MSTSRNGIRFSVIIPAYNEEKRIPPTVEKTVLFFSSKNEPFEIIVVDDGSSDRTAELINDLAGKYQMLSLIRLPENRGKGAAVKAGMLKAAGEFLLFQDADGATPIAEFDKLFSAMNDHDIAIGSRALNDAGTKVISVVHRKVLGRVFNLAANAIAAPGIKDTQCGFKLFKAQAAKQIFSLQKINGFSFDVEVLYLAGRLGFKVAEIPVNWTNIPGTKVSVVWDGIKMLCEILFIKLLHRNL